MEFQVAQGQPYNKMVAGLYFLVIENNEIIKTIWVWYPLDFSRTYHDDESGRIKEEYLVSIFEAVKEVIFYDHIKEESFQFRLGEDNVFKLKLEDDFSIHHEQNSDYEKDFCQLVAHEICQALEPQYLEGLSASEILEKVWFPKDTIEKVLNNPNIEESLCWSEAEDRRFRLTNEGKQFLQSYRPPNERKIGFKKQ